MKLVFLYILIVFYQVFSYRFMRSHFASSIAYNLFKLYKVKCSNDLIYLRTTCEELENSFRKTVTRMFESVGTYLHHRTNEHIFFYIDYMIIYNYLQIFYTKEKSRLFNSPII